MTESISGPGAPGEEMPVGQLLDFYAFLIQATGLVARADDIPKLYQDICRLGIQLDRRLVLAWVGLIEPDIHEFAGECRPSHHGPGGDCYHY
jgi:hypothetical protein